MATYVITQGIQGPEGAQGATGPAGATGADSDASGINVGAFTGILNTATPPSNVQEALDVVDGLEVGSNEVYFAYQLINEADLSTEYEGSTFNSGVSISDLPPGLEAGARIVVVPTDPELLYQSFVTDGTTTALYEDPQISTFAKNPTDLGGQSVLLNVFYDAVSEQPYIVNTTYLMFGPSLIPQSSGGGGLHASNVNVGAFTGILNSATPPSTVQEALDIVDGLELGASPYTPADSANWTGADPTTIAEAIDRIAAALGPIA